MIKYEVVTFNVETKNGKDAFEKWLNQPDQYERLVKECDTLEEAKKIYDGIVTRARYMSRYFLHECKAINAVHYDENGEFDYVDGVEFDAPDYSNNYDDEDEDDEI